MQPFISVIVATYKHDDMLLRALNSLAEQTYKNFEIIVVDDNANEEYNARVNNIITKFKQENGSLICAELLGIAPKPQEPTPEARTAEYFKKRPCVKMVEEAARIWEEYLSGSKFKE